jgi:cyclopropane fatty-acyl-phospholipid synthase-like methyltransferase
VPRRRATRVVRGEVRSHYDLSNEIFQLWQTCSCAYFERDDTTLHEKT